MTTVAEQEVLSAVELDLTVDSIGEGAEGAESTATSESDQTTADAAEQGREPLFRVVKGAPSDVELAALTCVLAAAAQGAAAPAPSGPPNMWGSPTLLHRQVAPFSPYAFPHLSHRRD